MKPKHPKRVDFRPRGWSEEAMTFADELSDFNTKANYIMQLWSQSYAKCDKRSKDYKDFNEFMVYFWANAEQADVIEYGYAISNPLKRLYESKRDNIKGLSAWEVLDILEKRQNICQTTVRKWGAVVIEEELV